MEHFAKPILAGSGTEPGSSVRARTREGKTFAKTYYSCAGNSKVTGN